MALASLVLSLLVAEGVLRLFGVQPDVLAIYTVDPGGHGSFRLKPNVDLTTAFAGRRITIRTNSHGMRWREVSPEAPRLASRIAFVGDSFTFGLWADGVEQSIVGVVDIMLRRDGHEALNFGVPGYGLIDEELILQDMVMKFGPRLVVLAFYNGNDFLDTYLGPHRNRVAASGVLETDWKHVESRIPAEFRRRRPPEILTHSYVYGLLKRTAQYLRPEGVIPTRSVGPSSRREMDRSYTSNEFWSQARYPDFAVTARDTSLAALGRMADLLSRKGVRFAIVTIPSFQQVYMPSAFRDGYDIELPQRFIAEFANARGLGYLDLLPPLRAYADRGGDPYYRPEGHLRNEGHRVVGEEIAAFLHGEMTRPPIGSPVLRRTRP
jgi:hypothetical protein